MGWRKKSTWKEKWYVFIHEKMHILNNIRSYLAVLRSSAATLSEVKRIMSFHFQRFPGGNATYRRIGMRLRRKMCMGEMWRKYMALWFSVPCM